MPLIAILRFIVSSFIIFMLLIAVLVFPPGKEIPLIQFTGPNLIGYGQVKIDLEKKVLINLIKAKLNDFWVKQEDKKNLPEPLLKLICLFQNLAFTKIIPYYAGAMLYQSDNSTKPIILYLINSRIHQSLFKFIALSISILQPDFHKKMKLRTKEIKINYRKFPIYQYENYSFMFYKNLCLVSDTLVAFNNAFTNTLKEFSTNIMRMKSMLNPNYDILIILGNRFKTSRLAQKYLEQKKNSINSEPATEFYETILQRIKIYSDSIMVTGIEANFVNDDIIKGKWLVVMKSKKAAQKFAIVIDGLHQLISQELANQDLFYKVERNNNNNQIISEFEIKGLKKLTRLN